MKTEVATLHHDYPSRIRQYASDKLQNLSKYYERTVSIRAMLERQKNQHRAELVANVGRGVTLVVDARAENINAAFDEALHRMARVLKRHKERLIDGRRKPKVEANLE